MTDIKDFIEISKYAGERFDLVQAGGGNSSVKLNSGEMLIKASGFLLSDISESYGYSKVDTKKIANIVKNVKIVNEQDKREREKLTAELVKKSTLDDINRPSIETLLHSFLYKYTLHTHPVVVNMVVVKKEWKQILHSIFENEMIALVEYETPGIELALALYDALENLNMIPNIIFLQNHGLIITSQNKDEIVKLTEYVLEKIENYLKVDMSKYKLTNKISDLYNQMNKSNHVAYLSEDQYLRELLYKNQELFIQMPFCPDSLVFCGISPVIIENLSDISVLRDYKEQYFELPKVIIFDKKLFFIALNIKKAKEMEDVFKFHIMVLEKNVESEKNFLEEQELSYLGNWEAEKYRQKI